MASFAESMKGFTDHLQSSIQERGDALTRINGATDLLLDDTKEFMSDVAHDHRTMAAELRATLDAHRVEQSRARRRRCVTIIARRSSRFGTTCARCWTRAIRVARRRSHQLRETFHQAQHELADDLREASQRLARIRRGTFLSQISRLDLARRRKAGPRRRGSAGSADARADPRAGSPARRSRRGPAVPDHLTVCASARARPFTPGTRRPRRGVKEIRPP